MDRRDAQVCQVLAAATLGLHRPFPDAAEIRLGAGNLLDAGHGAVHLAFLGMADAIPEALRGLKVLDAEKLAGLSPHPADVVPDRLASVWNPERLAWGVLAERSMAVPDVAAAELYTQDAGPFVA